MQEEAHGTETASILATAEPQAEHGQWYAWAEVEKWDSQADFDAGLPPAEKLVSEKNILVNVGIRLLEDLLIVAGGSAYTTGADAHLGVGTGVAAADVGDTALTTPNGARKVATATVSNQTVTFQATFNAGEATGAWEEAGVFNALAAGTMLNHKVTTLGTKAAGAVWVLTMNITIS